MCIRYRDKVSLVTGASRGIGHATVALLRKNGATVIGCSRGTDTDIQCDVSHTDDVHRLFDYIQSTYGKLDILVNNAAIPCYGLALNNMSDPQINESLSVNLIAPIILAHRLYPILKKAKSSGIIYVG